MYADSSNSAANSYLLNFFNGLKDFNTFMSLNTNNIIPLSIQNLVLNYNNIMNGTVEDVLGSFDTLQVLNKYNMLT